MGSKYQTLALLTTSKKQCTSGWVIAFVLPLSIWLTQVDLLSWAINQYGLNHVEWAPSKKEYCCWQAYSKIVLPLPNHVWSDKGLRRYTNYDSMGCIPYCEEIHELGYVDWVLQITASSMVPSQWGIWVPKLYVIGWGVVSDTCLPTSLHSCCLNIDAVVALMSYNNHPLLTEILDLNQQYYIECKNCILPICVFLGFNSQ